ncbi:SHOCT domain-containing protein [Mycobacterium sp.]|uniref:SHOCT domain-containing protein n=1 Tax=Mycobacterium sp. TaxID=1785 RepID=UPI0025F5D622|nr:SHOCT domain-containing protein [Mycobacterium sp.]
MMMGHCGDGGWAHWVWMAETFLLWALLITAVVLIVRHLVSLGGAGASLASGAPREEGLLAERYARGELDDGEYQRRMTVLRQNR